jgi:hypothetical protein
MLMSDEQQNRGGNAADVKIGNAPVYTFGFGADYDPTVLNAVARNSTGETFSVVNDVDKLSMAFSQCLAGLLTVVVQDLTVTVTPVKDESTIQKVAAGNYPQDAGPVGHRRLRRPLQQGGAEADRGPPPPDHRHRARC